MFSINDKVKFIKMDTNYLKKLHGICSEVYYMVMIINLT